MDTDFETIQEYYNAVWCRLDFIQFCELFAEDVKISYTYNDAPENIEFVEFITRMEKGHFKNTTGVKVTSLIISKTQDPGVFIVDEKVTLERLGQGRDEDGPGTYLYTGTGCITVKDGLICGLNYAFTKVKK
jgi:hypothetical protein